MADEVTVDFVEDTVEVDFEGVVILLGDSQYNHTVKKLTNADSPYTVQLTDQVIHCDTTDGDIVINLSEGVSGKWLKIISEGVNQTKPTPYGTEKLFGFNSLFPMNNGEIIVIDFIIEKGWW